MSAPLIRLPNPHDPDWHRRPRVWTAPQLWRLMSKRDAGLSDRAIGRQFGLTASTIKCTRLRYGIPGTRARDLGTSAQATAARLGVPETRVGEWIRCGWLSARKQFLGGGGMSIFRIQEAELRAFLQEPSTWTEWQPEHITDPVLRRWAMALRAEDDLLRIPAAAKMVGCWPQTLNKWIRRGALPAITDRRDHRCVWRSALLAWKERAA